MINTNHEKISESLRKKGWEEHHISRTIDILKKSEEFKSPSIKFLDSILFYLTLLLLFIVNVLVLTGLLPVVIEFPIALILFFVSLTGLCFGFFIDHILRHMDIYIKHYAITGIFMALTSAAIMLVVIEVAKAELSTAGIFFNVNPLLLVMFYVFSFSVPHFIYKIKEA